MQSPTEGAIYADVNGELYQCTDSPCTAGVPTRKAEYMTVVYEKVGDGEWQDHGEEWRDEVGRVQRWEYVTDELHEGAFDLIQSAAEGDRIEVEYDNGYDNSTIAGEVTEVQDEEIRISDDEKEYSVHIGGTVYLESDTCTSTSRIDLGEFESAELE